MLSFPPVRGVTPGAWVGVLGTLGGTGMVTESKGILMNDKIILTAIIA